MRAFAETRRVHVAVIGVERPTAFPGIDIHRQFHGIGDGVLQAGDRAVGIAVDDLDPGGGHSILRPLPFGLRLVRGVGPARRFQHADARRFSGGRQFHGPGDADISGIAAGAGRDFTGHRPGFGKAGRDNPGRTLAEPVMAAAAVDTADARLVAIDAAIAGRANGGPDNLGPQRARNHARRNRRGRTAARSARGSLQVPGVSRFAGMGRRELGRHRFTDNDGAGFAQGGHRRTVPAAVIPLEQGRALFGTELRGFHDVLHADGHPVER